jgi:IS5 family transposase
MRNLSGIDLGVEAAPDETTVCKFRHLLEKNKLGKKLLTTVVTRTLAGYRTYRRSSRAYNICGQSCTYAVRRVVTCVHWFVSRI